MMKEEHERAGRAEHEKELERLQSNIRYQQELERQLEVWDTEDGDDPWNCNIHIQ